MDGDAAVKPDDAKERVRGPKRKPQNYVDEEGRLKVGNPDLIQAGFSRRASRS